MMHQPTKNETTKNKKTSPASFMRFSAMATQMGAVIGLFVFLGVKLDAWLGTKFIFVLILSLTGVLGSLYYFIKLVLKEGE